MNEWICKQQWWNDRDRGNQKYCETILTEFFVAFFFFFFFIFFISSLHFLLILSPPSTFYYCSSFYLPPPFYFLFLFFFFFFFLSSVSTILPFAFCLFSSSSSPPLPCISFPYFFLFRLLINLLPSIFLFSSPTYYCYWIQLVLFFLLLSPLYLPVLLLLSFAFLFHTFSFFFFLLIPGSSPYCYWTHLVLFLPLLPLLPVLIFLLLLLLASSKCRQTESLVPEVSHYPADNSTCWQVNMEQRCHEIWLKEKIYGPTDKLPHCHFPATQIAVPWDRNRATAVRRWRLAVSTTARRKDQNPIHFRGVSVHSIFHPALGTRRHFWPRSTGVVKCRGGATIGIKLTSGWQLICSFVVNKRYCLTVTVVIIQVVE